MEQNQRLGCSHRLQEGVHGGRELTILARGHRRQKTLRRWYHNHSLIIINPSDNYWLFLCSCFKGAIGDLITVRAFYREALLDSRKDWGQEDLPIEAWAKLLGWRAILEKSGGGVVIDGGQHWLRPLQILVGNIEEVTIDWSTVLLFLSFIIRLIRSLEQRQDLSKLLKVRTRNVSSSCINIAFILSVMTIGETLAHGLIRFEKPHSHIIGTLECLYVAATVLWKWVHIQLWSTHQSEN